ncbi:YraN family protein [Paenibacillus sp. GXUN7292]|uniref:YraN family protein n=1 Tax=Paenibacillus sp. GXUN7292 TaxID=3422499 RepID=UPI003D7ED502
MSLDKKQTGQLGEQLAIAYFIESGYHILHTNWRCKTGEIDIIAENDGRVIFVEVRTRTGSGKYGTAAESVHNRKQQRIRLNAQYYLQSKKWNDRPVRFDVIAIELGNTAQSHQLKHIEGAF